MRRARGMTGDDVVRLVDSATRAGAWPLRRERRRALLLFGALVAIVAPMRGLGLPTGMKAAARADILWLTAFEVGLSGWMALFLVLFRLRITAELAGVLDRQQTGRIIAVSRRGRQRLADPQGIKEAMCTIGPTGHPGGDAPRQSCHV